MTTVAEIRGDLCAVLNRISGWTCTNGYIGDSVNTYQFKVSRAPFDPRYVFGESKKVVTFNVTAYAPRANAEQSEADLDALCEPTGTGSLIATVQTGSYWSVTLDYAQVVQCSDVHIVTWWDSTEYLVCVFQIEVSW